jgi:hypothetical protein
MFHPRVLKEYERVAKRFCVQVHHGTDQPKVLQEMFARAERA